MSHQVIIPPTDTGGGSFMAGGEASVTVKWNPPHDMKPREERRRIEKAERMRLEIEAMLNAPYEPMGEQDE